MNLYRIDFAKRDRKSHIKINDENFTRPKCYKTGVFNDPLGRTHSLASSEHCFLCFEKWGRWWRTDNMYEKSNPYRKWLWFGRVDQLYVFKEKGSRMKKWNETLIKRLRMG